MIEQFTLPNGLRVLCEQLPHLRSVSMGVWVKAGSILEREHENGLSHLIEHMAFKGTGRRSAKQIAQEMDAVGGYLNAATSKLCTCYYAKVIDENLPLAADILSDIVRFPAIDPKELDKERNVVLEEISMTDDSPEDVAYDLIASAMFGKQPLGQTILGPRELIASYTREDILAFRARHYSPMNTCVAIAGNFDLNQVKDLMAQRFGDWTGGAGEIFPVNAVNQRPQTLTADKDTEQAHICLGYRGKPLGDADAYPMAVFNSILAAACPRACSSASARNPPWPTACIPRHPPTRTAAILPSTRPYPPATSKPCWRRSMRKPPCWCARAPRRRSLTWPRRSSRAALSWVRKAPITA